MSSSPSSSSQGVVFATAMALSGTVILLALRLHKSLPSSPPPTLRSCISSEGKRKTKNRKKKRVHFADDVVDSSGDGKEFRRKHRVSCGADSYHSNSESKVREQSFNGGSEVRGMPANRVALYNGILRDRMANRLAYSY